MSGWGCMVGCMPRGFYGLGKPSTEKSCLLMEFFRKGGRPPPPPLFKEVMEPVRHIFFKSHMTPIWPPYDPYMNLIWPPYDPILPPYDPIWPWYDSHMTPIWYKKCVSPDLVRKNSIRKHFFFKGFPHQPLHTGEKTGCVKHWICGPINTSPFFCIDSAFGQ